MTVAELGRRMSAGEYYQWLAYDTIVADEKLERAQKSNA